MSKEKAIKRLKELEKNRFKVSGKKFQGQTWFDALLADANLESILNEFLADNSKAYGEGAKVKEVIRLTINNKPAIEIKYTLPNDNEVYSDFYGEFCHYTPQSTGEFTTDLSTDCLLAIRFNTVLQQANESVKIVVKSNTDSVVVTASKADGSVKTGVNANSREHEYDYMDAQCKFVFDTLVKRKRQEEKRQNKALSKISNSLSMTK